MWWRITPRRMSFNPRTHMGCDEINLMQWCGLFCFNPRTHMGCDQVTTRNTGAPPVSIHAPTWGATPGADSDRLLPLFQSTHPHGVRRISMIVFDDNYKFQSTHPHGVRLHIEYATGFQFTKLQKMRESTNSPRMTMQRRVYYCNLLMLSMCETTAYSAKQWVRKVHFRYLTNKSNLISQVHHRNQDYNFSQLFLHVSSNSTPRDRI